MAQGGESALRELEAKAIARMTGIANHVIAVGEACQNQENWNNLSALGTTVWVDTPVEVIARRLNSKIDDIKKRPLLTDLADIESKELRYAGLLKRIKSLLSEGTECFQQSRVAFSDGFSTSEDAARRLQFMLAARGNERADL